MVAVDLGINTTATVSVVAFDGTVIHREFIHPGRDIDRRDKRLKSVSTRASKTMDKGGRKGSTLRQRFHGWLKAMIHDFTDMKWQEVGGKIIDVVAAYTSKLAYDGSA